MCGRYQIDDDPRHWLARDLPSCQPLVQGEWTPRFNVAPHQQVPVVRAGDEAPELVMMQWGFVPHFVREARPKVQPINARAETAADKPFFREAARRRRCILPASGFYEWKKQTQGAKQPWFIHATEEGEPLYFAGIWDTWRAPDGPRDTVAILTCPANNRIRPLHDRQPVIMPRSCLEHWLRAWNPELLAPVPAERLSVMAISRTINNARRDDPGVFQPLKDKEANDGKP